MRYGYIYLVTDLREGKNYGFHYVGQKKGKFRSNYYGSGDIIKALVKKYGTDSFSVRLIDYAESQTELDNKEIAWISDVGCHWPKGYNLTNGGQGGSIHPKGCNCPFCKSKRGEHEGENHPMFGKHHRMESINKMKNSFPDRHGKNHPMFGRRGDNNPLTGTKWIYNVSEKRSKRVSSELVPVYLSEGWLDVCVQKRRNRNE